MGLGIYPYEVVRAGVDHFIAGGYPEARTVRELLDGEVIPMVHTVDGITIGIGHRTGRSGVYLLVGRLALKVKPLSAEQHWKLVDEGQPTDPRGLVDRPDAWFGISGEEPVVDMYNTEVVDLQAWSAGTLAV